MTSTASLTPRPRRSATAAAVSQECMPAVSARLLSASPDAGALAARHRLVAGRRRSPSGSAGPSLCCSSPTCCYSARPGCPPAGRRPALLAYGVIAVAGAQLCYFSAVQYLSVGVALLLEYLAPVLLIG